LRLVLGLGFFLVAVEIDSEFVFEFSCCVEYTEVENEKEEGKETREEKQLAAAEEDVDAVEVELVAVEDTDAEVEKKEIGEDNKG
jgi:hypothetical protein